MSNDLTIVEEPLAEGKAMSALTGRKKKFVLALLKLGASTSAQRQAAAQAGYDPMYGYQLMHDDRVLAAIREVATKTVAGAALTGVQVMIDIALNKEHKDQFRAAKELAALNGFTSEQRIVVEHIDRDAKDKIQEIRVLAEKMGLDPRLLIERAGVVIDADFEIITPATQQVDDSDW
jgi:phage terminase small subunit